MTDQRCGVFIFRSNWCQSIVLKEEDFNGRKSKIHNQVVFQNQSLRYKRVKILKMYRSFNKNEEMWLRKRAVEKDLKFIKLYLLILLNKPLKSKSPNNDSKTQNWGCESINRVWYKWRNIVTNWVLMEERMGTQ